MGNVHIFLHDTGDDDDAWMPKRTVQTKRKPISQLQKVSESQVKNKSGGWVFQLSDMDRLKRFLFLGNDAASYKAGDRSMKRESAQCIDRLISEHKGEEVVGLIREISVEGRAAKQEPTLYALAICARSNDEETKKAAYEAFFEMCRIPTHLFIFVKYCEEESVGTGWGRSHRRAVTSWYEEIAKDNPARLAMLLTKYKKREDWSHRDLFRLSHLKPENKALQVMVRYVIKGFPEAKKLEDVVIGDLEEEDQKKLQKMMDFLEATDKARKCTDEEQMCQLIEKQRLVREHVPTALLNSKKVWISLLKNMPHKAMIRNLGKMTNLGLLVPGSEYEKAVVLGLNDEKRIKKARIHPFDVMIAMLQYQKGKGDKGKLSWMPSSAVVTALDAAYHLSFKYVTPTGKRLLLAVDVSGSMGVPCMGCSSITCRDAAAAMMMSTVRTETDFDIVAFSHTLTSMGIKKEDKLNEVIRKTSNLPFGGTDCALPMLWANEKKKQYDAFIVYTDNETWYGKVHPFKALQDYRVDRGVVDAKLIVVGMSSSGFTIADPNDPGMMDIVGFDSGAPETMANFIRGEMCKA